MVGDLGLNPSVETKNKARQLFIGYLALFYKGFCKNMLKLSYVFDLCNIIINKSNININFL